MSINWFVQRLRTMSIPELGFRVTQLLQKKKEKIFAPKIHTSVPLISEAPRILRIKDISYPVKRTICKVFDYEVDYSNTINWHQDISTGKEFPITFSKDIDTRTDRYGSAKHVWEINRLQFLTQICLNFQSTQNEKYLHHFIDINNSWIRNNPYLNGVNWYSNIEVNLRLITWFICWEILNVNELMKKHPQLHQFVNELWIPTIYYHCKYSFDNPSKYSSANNHYISEAAGLFIASSLWRFKESERWNQYSKAILEKEIQKQHSANGINKEETAKYIQFITDFFLLSFIVGQHTKNPFSTKYSDQLKAICYYMYHLLDSDGNIPNYGDEDDGRTFVIGSQCVMENFKSILTSAAVLFKDPTLKSKSNGFDIKNEILLGNEGRQTFDSIKMIEPTGSSRLYPDEGHFILNKKNQEHEIFLHFDAAALGYLSIAAHGHADALSFILHVDGAPIFVDSGTYVYHTELNWRNYFAGTLAHNTIRVGEQDQAKIAGPLLWRNHFQTKTITSNSDPAKDNIVAEHNGYKHLGVTHQRGIYFDKEKDTITIVDDLKVTGSKTICYEIPFHIHPAVAIEKTLENNYKLKKKGVRDISIRIDPQLHPKVVTGQMDPILGWYSEAFQNKEACSVIYSQLNSNKSFKLTTEITIENNEY